MPKQTKITRSAKYEDCLVRIPGYCNFDPQTTVCAHNNGAGMGIKAHDIHSAYCCSACHDVIDGRVKTEFSKEEIQIWHDAGIKRTQLKLIEKGLIKVA